MSQSFAAKHSLWLTALDRECAMTKTMDQAVEQLIEVVKQALEDGRATPSDLEEWLVAAILLEEMALEEEREAREDRTFAAWMGAAGTLH